MGKKREKREKKKEVMCRTESGIINQNKILFKYFIQRTPIYTL